MSYDRYMAICHPLRYNIRMTCKKAVVFILLVWLYSFFIIVLLIMMIVPLQLCGNTINKVYCLTYSIVKLACSNTRANNIYGLFVTFVTVFIPLLLICYTYVRILQVCFSGSRQTRQKAINTCMPHLASLLNFSFGVCFEIIQSRFDIKGVHILLQIVLSLYFLTCPPLFSPLMYGLKMSKIRSFCKNMLFFSVLNCGRDWKRRKYSLHRVVVDSQSLDISELYVFSEVDGNVEKGALIWQHAAEGVFMWVRAWTGWGHQERPVGWHQWPSLWWVCFRFTQTQQIKIEEKQKKKKGVRRSHCCQNENP